MSILKTKHIYSQSCIPQTVSQKTMYPSDELDRISFTVFGQGNVSRMYGSKGIVFLTNNLELYKLRSNMPFEWFTFDKLSINNLTIGISKTFASQPISSLRCKDIVWVYRNNNEEMRENIISFLHDETGVPPSKITTDEEFYEYYHRCLQYVVNPDYPVDCTIYELITALKVKYGCMCKTIIIDYE